MLTRNLAGKFLFFWPSNLFLWNNSPFLPFLRLENSVSGQFNVKERPFIIFWYSSFHVTTSDRSVYLLMTKYLRKQPNRLYTRRNSTIIIPCNEFDYTLQVVSLDEGYKSENLSDILEETEQVSNENKLFVRDVQDIVYVLGKTKQRTMTQKDRTNFIRSSSNIVSPKKKNVWRRVPVRFLKFVRPLQAWNRTGHPAFVRQKAQRLFCPTKNVSIRRSVCPAQDFYFYIKHTKTRAPDQAFQH